MPFPYDPVPFARPAPVGPRELAQLTQIARDVRHGNTDQARVDWLLSCTAELLEEVAARREFMAGIRATLVGDNIAFLPARRA